MLRLSITSFTTELNVAKKKTLLMGRLDEMEIKPTYLKKSWVWAKVRKGYWVLLRHALPTNYFSKI